MENIEKNIIKIRSEIGDVQLVAISKAQSIEKIKAALKTGQKDFGESYLQEALEKINALAKNDIVWHYIGNIQSRKAALIAQNFDWVQSVSTFEKASLLNKNRPVDSLPLNICIQVNISEEKTKSGVLVNEIMPLAKKIQEELPRLKLRGLMTIPAYTKDPKQQLETFKKLRNEFEKLKTHGIPVDTLSMGMSHDFKTAIKAGSSMVRIGSAIFGDREGPVPNPTII